MSPRRRLPRVADLPLRTRVTAVASVVAALGAVAGAILFVVSMRNTLLQELSVSTVQQASTIATQIQQGRAPADAISGSVDDVTEQVVDRSGRVLASDRPGASALRRTPGLSRGVRVDGLADKFAVSARPTSDGRLVVVGRSEEHVTEAITTAVGLLAVAVPAGVALLALVVWLSLGRALRPVEDIRRQAATITSEHLHRRLPVHGAQDEIASLAVTLNEMLDRIDSAHTLQRQFVSDASHELRSPLAAIRQMTEVVTRYPDAMTVRELAEDVAAEEQRMEVLVTSLLTLARLEDSSTRDDRAVVRLDQLVVDEATRAESISGRSVEVRVRPGQVRGSSVLLTQLVGNLLSNAVRHASSRVVVTLAPDDAGLRLRVEDDGEGIPEGDRERVFERFVRLDDARSREAGGMGLGLAIVRKVAETAHATVTIDRSALGGAGVSVVFPAREPAAT